MTVKDRPDSQHGDAKSGEKYHFDVPTEHTPSIRLPKQDSQKPTALFAMPEIKAAKAPETTPTEQKKLTQKPEQK